jgi:hypothetical protein
MGSVGNTEAVHGFGAHDGPMTFSVFFTVAAAVAGLSILVVMAAVPFLLDLPRGRAAPDHRHLLGARLRNQDTA